jgi:hypothetical protein
MILMSPLRTSTPADSWLALECVLQEWFACALLVLHGRHFSCQHMAGPSDYCAAVVCATNHRGTVYHLFFMAVLHCALGCGTCIFAHRQVGVATQVTVTRQVHDGPGLVKSRLVCAIG